MFVALQRNRDFEFIGTAAARGDSSATAPDARV
jgi:hypothetical protein